MAKRFIFSNEFILFPVSLFVSLRYTQIRPINHFSCATPFPPPEKRKNPTTHSFARQKVAEQKIKMKIIPPTGEKERKRLMKIYIIYFFRSFCFPPSRSPSPPLKEIDAESGGKKIVV